MGGMISLIVLNQVESRITLIIVIGLSQPGIAETAVSSTWVLSRRMFYRSEISDLSTEQFVVFSGDAERRFARIFR